MSCPQCNAELAAGATCENCAKVKRIGSSKTLKTPAPPPGTPKKTSTTDRTVASPARKVTPASGTSSTAGYASPAAGASKKPAPLQSNVATSIVDPSVAGTLVGQEEGGPPMASETATSLNTGMIGQVLGSYRILDILGEGGMGRVYLAEHTKIGRRVALKMLHSHLAHSPEVVRRFFDEARAVNRILHEHIVEITDFVENEDGNNYFIMEHLRGKPLADVMEQEDDYDSPIARSLGIGVQVASALAAVHTANIVHRDLKPENVFLTQRGGQKDFVKLLDFGIAKLVGDHGDGIKLQTTQAGVIMGTPDYMSPEQASAGKIDHRTDIYSLGVILYELCTGRLPFIADNFGDLIVMHKTKKPLKPSKVPNLAQEIPAPLEALILECLQKDPADRPQSAKEVEDRLHEIAWGFAVELENFEFGSSSKRSGRRGLLMGAAGVVVAAGALAFAMTKSDEPGKAAPAVEAAPAVVTQPPPVEKVPELAIQVARSFLSEPTGAMVYTVGARPELLGVTPFTMSFTESSDAVKVEFRKPGFASVEQEFAPAKRGSLSVELEAEVVADNSKPKTRKGSKSGKSKSGKSKSGKSKSGKKSGFKEGAVMDPFAK